MRGNLPISEGALLARFPVSSEGARFPADSRKEYVLLVSAQQLLQLTAQQLKQQDIPEMKN